MKETIMKILTSPETFAYYRIARVVFIAIAFYLFVWIFFLLIKSTWMQKRYYEDYTEALTYRPFGRKKEKKKWDKVLGHLEKGKESDFKLALIEADNILGEVFKKMGYEGDTVSQVLDNLDEGILPNLKEVKEAHSVRNKVVHDPDYRLSREETERILKVYEEALRGLELF